MRLSKNAAFSPDTPLAARTNNLEARCPEVAGVLGSLRRRIRLVVLVEGLVAVVVAAMVWFWAALAIDYLPVKLGFAELSFPARAILLAVALALILVQLYRLIGRRLFVSIKDRSLALLIEQRHPEFEEALITTVDHASAESARVDVPIDMEMVELTQRKAERLIGSVAPKQIVGFRFLHGYLILAGVLIASLVGLAIFRFDNLQLAVKRLCFLENQKWPRRVYLELEGLKIKTDNPVANIEELGQVLPLRGQEILVPRGASLSLTVRAQESDPLSPWRTLPSNCLMYYRSADGERGTQALNRIGAPKNGWQTWSLNGVPLDRVLSDFEFTIRAEDFRTQPYRVKIVDQAAVTETNLDCRYPGYLSRHDSLSWTPRTIRWTGRAALPVGTSFTIHGKASKSLNKAYVWNPTKSEMSLGTVDGERFEFAVDPIHDPLNVEFYFVDSDNLVSDQAHRITVEPIADEAPEVVARIAGIGTAITPQALLRFQGQIHDDYRVQQTWVELATPLRELPPAVQPTSAKGELNSAIDLAELVRSGLELTVDEGSELEVIIKAKDYFDLDGQESNVGVGDRYSLELVSAGRLLRMLEQTEVSQRRRLEQIFEEVTSIRGYLARTRKQPVGSRGAGESEPGDENAASGASLASRQQAMRIVFSQRSKLQAMKAAQEIRGIADAFKNLRLQLINNRIDAEDRKQRLADKIIAPLEKTSHETIKTLAATIDELEEVLKQIDRGIGREAAEELAPQLVDRGLVETDAVLQEIDAILSVLVKYESQNELLEIVRALITEQETLIERTKEKRQKEAFEGLLD